MCDWSGPKTGKYWEQMTDEEVLRYHYGRKQYGFYGFNPVWFEVGQVPGSRPGIHYNWSFLIVGGQIVNYVSPERGVTLDDARLLGLFRLVVFPEVIE